MPVRYGGILNIWLAESPLETVVDDQLLIKYPSQFDRGRIVAYRDCGLSFREIGSHVGRNQTTVIRICDRWMQEVTMDQRGRSHPPQCTTSRQNKQIVRMCLCVPFDAVYSRAVCPQDVHCLIYSWRKATDVSAANGVMKKGCGRQNRMKLSSLTSHASVCNATMVGFDSGDTVDNLHRYTDPAPGIMVWGGFGYHSRTPLVHIAGTLNSQLYISEVLEPVVLHYLQGFATAIFQQDNAQPHVARIIQRFFVNHQIELLP
ncbi:transposable element Tcb1 transposase [Trichonephila clavipes]|nr:transposable element Tcb1 transposase [Trichonephila clavipes]